MPTSRDSLQKNASSFVIVQHVPPSLTMRASVKNLMYGFGDDRNPATDTVSVMEEILVEFIVDVVRSFCWLVNHFTTPLRDSAKPREVHNGRADCP